VYKCNVILRDTRSCTGSYSRRETTVHEAPLLESHPPLARFVGAICI